MKIRWQRFGPDEVIPVSEYLKNRKLRKYFNRETAATIVTLSKLLDGTFVLKQGDIENVLLEGVRNSV